MSAPLIHARLSNAVPTYAEIVKRGLGSRFDPRSSYTKDKKGLGISTEAPELRADEQAAVGNYARFLARMCPDLQVHSRTETFYLVL